MAFAAQNDPQVLKKRFLNEFGRRLLIGLRADIEIDAAVLQARFQRRIPAFDQMQLDLRVAGAKRRQRLRQQRDMRGERQTRDHFAGGAAVKLLDLVAGAPHLGQDRAGAAHEGLAHRGEDHAAGAALEQRRAELALELMDAARQRRLGELQMPRRGAQTAALGDGNNVAKLIEFHVEFLGLSPSWDHAGNRYR